MALETLTKENFNEKVQSHQIVVLDFWAPWCAPCRQFAPIFEEVAKEHPDILFGKINTEEEQELAAYFQIRSIPTVMVIKEGIVVFSQPGLLPKDALEDIIKQVKELDMDKVREEIEKEQKNQEQK
ncbi:MAG: thioredoxin [Epsilonproteobacteria bacterium]|nr:thioredoxin [Campylobacterota bacterium]